MNILAYIFYLLITYIITFKVGLIFYRNGKVYILQLLQGNEHLSGSINRLLLIGYYLLNLGYAALMISTWKTVHTIEEVLVTVFSMTGKIMLTLAVIHFINMTVIYLLSKQRKYFNHHKT
ncbi:MAG: hypothetical protein HZB42_09900 [Sphingobacteriales bacterium]|nr:hypothetical protein [Sphingobacteriales bacterium]